MRALLWLCSKLPLSVASAIGGRTARALGPHLSRSKIARRIPDAMARGFELDTQRAEECRIFWQPKCAR